jgi:hypothetical protein
VGAGDHQPLTALAALFGGGQGLLKPVHLGQRGLKLHAALALL